MDTNKNIVEVTVVGAGHAGLSASYFLKQHGLQHLVFERGKIGESWHSQRWDSFALNTPNRLNLLPGEDFAGNDPDSFPSAVSFVNFLQKYATRFQLPVLEETEVVKIEKSEGKNYFIVTVSQNGILKNCLSRQVIICSGTQNVKKVPECFGNVSLDVLQLHASEYRNSQQLPAGAVLVVGSAQSGCQVAEDLVDAGRKVFLSTSAVARIPRRYRGKDIMDWLKILGFFDVRTEDVTDPAMFRSKAPQVSGTGHLGHTVSLQYLAKKGVAILGTLSEVERYDARFRVNAAEHVRFADEFSKKVKNMIDDFIKKSELSIHVPEEDAADLPDVDVSCASCINYLNLKEQNIQSIIWTTGFDMDFRYINLPVLDRNGSPQHHHGLSKVDGLYFLGLPWLRSRKSGVIFGINEDAEFITGKVNTYAQKMNEVTA